MSAEESEEWNETRADSDSQESDSPGDTEQVEIQEVDEGGAPATPSSEIEQLATFREQEGALTALVIPVIKQGHTSWRIRVHLQGAQGAPYMSETPITDEQAEDLGMSKGIQDRLNAGLRHAQKNLNLPQSLRGQQRAKRSLSDLEAQME